MSQDRRHHRIIPALLVTVLGLATVAMISPAPDPGFETEVLQDIEAATSKFVALAGALTDEQLDWRPDEGVRSAREVFLHVAGNNYFLPTVAGVDAPRASGIGGNYQSVVTFENRGLGKAAVVEHLEASFAHLTSSIENLPSSELDRALDVFGTDSTVRGLWILTATHLHEHLGQAIAYARTKGVTPPWSN